jgi:hypothetical protein
MFVALNNLCSPSVALLLHFASYTTALDMGWRRTCADMRFKLSGKTRCFKRVHWNYTGLHAVLVRVHKQPRTHEAVPSCRAGTHYRVPNPA